MPVIGAFKVAADKDRLLQMEGRQCILEARNEGASPAFVRVVPLVNVWEEAPGNAPREIPEWLDIFPIAARIPPKVGHLLSQKHCRTGMNTESSGKDGKRCPTSKDERHLHLVLLLDEILPMHAFSAFLHILLYLSTSRLDNAVGRTAGKCGYCCRTVEQGVDVGAQAQSSHVHVEGGS